MIGKAWVAAAALVLGAAMPGYAAKINLSEQSFGLDAQIGRRTCYQQFSIRVEPGDTLTDIAKELEGLRIPAHLLRAPSSPSLSWEDLYRQNPQLQNPNNLRVGERLQFQIRDYYGPGYAGINMTI